MLAGLSNLRSPFDPNRGCHEHSPWTAEYLAIRTDRWRSPGLFWLICFSLCTALASSATDVATYHNDIARTGKTCKRLF